MFIFLFFLKGCISKTVFALQSHFDDFIHCGVVQRKNYKICNCPKTYGANCVAHCRGTGPLQLCF